MQPMQSPAAWHPDPTGRYEYRYYNGERWTSDVAVDGRHFVDVSGQAAPPSAPVGMPTKRPAIRGYAVASFWVALGSLLLGWIPFAFVVGFGGAVTAFVFAIIALRRSSRSDTDRTRHGRGLAIAGLVLSILTVPVSVAGFLLTREVIREFNAFADAGPYEATIDSCDTDDRLVTVTGTLTNLSDRTRSYVVEVRYSVLGSDVETSDVRVDDVPAGASRTFETSAFVPTPEPITDITAEDGSELPGIIFGVSCEIGDVTGPNPFGLE